MKTEVIDKREAILRAALKLFTEKGFHGTPTSKIAQEAGVATGTLFHYFKTKEELINKLYIEIKEDLTAALSAGLEDEQTIRGKIRRIWMNSVHWGLQNLAKFNFFLQFSSSPYISKMTKEQATEHLRFLHEIIEEGKHQDVLKAMPADLILDVVTGVVQGTTIHFSNNSERLKDEHYVEMAFNMFWDCIRR
jgi:AcrR family transcriptional regulator